ncbi:methyl-accepting chemotaxis protein [Fervidicola ferrireducens]|uniref:methyl-accepting chemotaxis protein n=1 Tax=Fervidicola ferrireducens TaxID=520764 RepID=UPI003CCBAB93
MEAARAAQTGHGFGVIATEIRKMAETSKKSIEEVKALTLNEREDIRNKRGHQSYIRIFPQSGCSFPRNL